MMGGGPGRASAASTGAVGKSTLTEALGDGVQKQGGEGDAGDKQVVPVPRPARPARRRPLGDSGRQVGRMQSDQILAPLQRALCAPGGLFDEGVEPGQDPAVPASRARRQLRDCLVGGRGEGLDLDQVVVEQRDQDAGSKLSREGRQTG
jgi:hypothetical protein